jgi:hypothetical protein
MPPTINDSYRLSNLFGTDIFFNQIRQTLN